MVAGGEGVERESFAGRALIARQPPSAPISAVFAESPASAARCGSPVVDAENTVFALAFWSLEVTWAGLIGSLAIRVT